MATLTRWTDAKLAAVRLPAGKTLHREPIGDGLYLVLRATRAGASRSFVYRTQVNGKRRWLTLGEYPSDLGLAAARAKVLEHHAVASQARRGEADHPALVARGEREAKLADPTVDKLVEAWLEEKQLLGRRDSTIALLRANYTNDVAPRIGEAKVARLTASALQDCVDTVLRRGKRGQAAQVYRTLRGLTRYAVRRGYLDADPMARLDNPKPYNPRAGSAVAADDEQLAALLAVLAGARVSLSVRLTIELQLLTGARPTEVRLAQWREIDTKRATWTLPPDRVKSGRKFRIHLSEQALALLERARAELDTGAGFVFPGAEADALEKMAVARALARLTERAAEAGGVKLRPHDLRRTFRTMLARLGVAPHVAERCLNHQDPSALERAYNAHDYWPEMVAAWDRAGAHLAALSAGGAHVVPIERGRKRA